MLIIDFDYRIRIKNKLFHVAIKFGKMRDFVYLLVKGCVILL